MKKRSFILTGSQNKQVDELLSFLMKPFVIFHKIQKSEHSSMYFDEKTCYIRFLDRGLY